MSIIIMILLLSVLILVHEAGHFLAAKAFGMRVEKFGFGLPVGPTLFQKKFGETTVLVHAFLLGGYIAFPDDEKDSGVPEDSPERFANKPIYQRAIVVSAGVVANVLCAFAFVLLTAFLWGNLPSGKYEVFVNQIIAPKSESIWSSGMQDGDKIYSINGSKIENTYALLQFIQASKSNDGLVDENAAIQSFIELKKINPVFAQDEIIAKGLAIKLPEFKYEAPASFDSMVLKGVTRHQDLQLKLNSEQKKIRDAIKGQNHYVSDGTATLKDISYAISDNSRPLNITVIREGKQVKLNPIVANEKGLIGIKLESKELLMPTKGPITAIKASTKYLYDNTYMMLYGLGQIFTGKVPLKDLHGIVAITKVGGDIIDNNGIFSGLLLIAIISMDLAIVNFLPIPALDGGHIMFLFFEKLRGKPLEEKTINIIGNLFFWLLILLMTLVMFNDILMLMQK